MRPLLWAPQASAACRGAHQELGDGDDLVVDGYIASKLVEPSREDVQRAYCGARGQSQRVRVSAAGDPKSKSAGASMAFVF
jgi:hypothetical protein